MEVLVRVLTLRNIGNNPVTIGVGPPIEFGTDITVGTGTGTNPFSTLFSGEGLVTIQPGKIFEIEELRVNAGQIENLVGLKALKAESLLRPVSELTEN